MEYASEQEKVLEEEDGWVDTHHYSDKDVSDKVGEMKLEERQPEILGKHHRCQKEKAEILIAEFAHASAFNPTKRVSS